MCKASVFNLLCLGVYAQKTYTVVGLCDCMCVLVNSYIKRYFKRSNSFEFSIEGFVLYLLHDLLTSNTVVARSRLMN